MPDLDCRFESNMSVVSSCLHQETPLKNIILSLGLIEPTQALQHALEPTQNLVGPVLAPFDPTAVQPPLPRRLVLHVSEQPKREDSRYKERKNGRGRRVHAEDAARGS